MNKIERIKTLVGLLNKASDAYYNTSRPTIPDLEFDRLYDELRGLEKETNFIMSNSPTINVGFEVKSKLEKVEHSTKMLSLDKTKDINILRKFIGDKEGTLSWKEDGLTIVLTYDNGILIDAVTRGNGSVGSRILHNAKVFKDGIPLSINYKGRLVVRGEGLISKQDFEEINLNNKYANPRNLTSGSIMSLDNKVTKKRQLQFKAFNIAECNKKFDLYSEQLDWLKELGFNPVEYIIVDENNIEKTVNYFKANIEKYMFTTDGLVFKYNNLEYGVGLGSTSHHNLDSLAFKWKDTTVETTLRDIKFQVGRTGILTPVAIFDEIEIEQSMVSKASLHNLSILKSLELGIHDTITVYKANMIIPQIDDNLTRSNTFNIPDKCPMCGSDTKIVVTDGAEFLYCSNDNCIAKQIQQISHYVSKNAMNIDGLSEKTIEKFINTGFLKDLSDIYKLEQYKKEILNMDGFRVKSYNKLIESIEKSKKCELSSFIFALGIPQIGLSTAKDLVEFANCENPNDALLFISTVPYEYLINMKDCGNITGNNIVNWFKDEKNIELVNELLNYIEFKEFAITETKKSGIFTNKKIYCTGTFNFYKKNELKKIVEDLGGTFSGGYAKSLDYLVVGSVKGSSKEDKAKKDGITIISEDEFIKMIKEG
jgi:DNA ligase (NAD+)